jgi:hypothetical protein
MQGAPSVPLFVSPRFPFPPSGFFTEIKADSLPAGLALGLEPGDVMAAMLEVRERVRV